MSRLNVEDVDYDCCGFLLTSLRKRKLEYRGGRDQSGIYDSAVGEWWGVRGWYVGDCRYQMISANFERLVLDCI